MELNKKVYLPRQGLKFLEQHQVVIDKFQQGLLWIIVTAFCVLGVLCLNHPISEAQKQEIMTYKTQYLYSYTRELSEQLLLQETPIVQIQYYRFLRILNHEQKRIQYQKDLDVQ